MQAAKEDIPLRGLMNIIHSELWRTYDWLNRNCRHFVLDVHAFICEWRTNKEAAIRWLERVGEWVTVTKSRNLGLLSIHSSAIG